jgi:peptide/nickel transport system substrate-binding protein
MVESREIKQLVDDVLTGRVNRRQLFARAAALGIGVPGILAMRASAQEASPEAGAPEVFSYPLPAVDPNAKAGGTLRVIVVDDPQSLNILVTQLAQSRNVMESVYDTLTYLDVSDPSFTIKGRLAESWQFTEPTKLDFKLRAGVKFHQGEDFTAEDVKWTIEYVKNPETASPNATVLAQIDTVEVLDPLTVRFNLLQPWPALPADLATIQIFSKTATNDQITTAPNGTGPFSWKEYVPGDHISIVKNPNYWMTGFPYLDQIDFRPIKEKSTSLAVMQAGDADVFMTPELKDKELIDGDEKLKSADTLLNDLGYILYINNSRAPMNDVNVRLALQHAVDRQTYFDAFLAGQGTANPSPWEKSHWAYNPINDTAFPYDLAKATEYLTAAGYTDGKKDGQQLTINLVYPKGYPELKQGSEMIQAALAEIKVEVKVEELELATWIDRIVTNPDFDVSWDQHGQRAVDPAWTLSLAFFFPPGPQNINQYTDEEIIGLISAGGSELVQEERKKIYDRFQERWNELAPGAIIGPSLTYHCLAADVEGFWTNPIYFQDFRTVWLNR